MIKKKENLLKKILPEKIATAMEGLFDKIDITTEIKDTVQFFSETFLELTNKYNLLTNSSKVKELADYVIKKHLDISVMYLNYLKMNLNLLERQELVSKIESGLEKLIISIKSLENKQKPQKYKEINELLNLLKEIDKETEAHSIRVNAYSHIIREKYNIRYPDKRLDYNKLDIGSLLHDIGKIAIKKNILHKQERLTDEEFEEIKSHTIAAKEILKGFLPDDIIKVIIYHHIPYNRIGGYPEIAPDEIIPEESMAIGVADAYDAMITRSYSSINTPEAAIKEIEAQKGKQFHPDMADIFIEAYKKDKWRFEMIAKYTADDLVKKI